MAITIDNYEFFLVQYLEGTLPESQAAEVEAFLESHPDIKEEVALFVGSPKLEPLPVEEVPSFSNPAARRTLAVGWRRYAAAACVLALFAAGLYLFPQQKEAPVVAKIDTLQPREDVEPETVNPVAPLQRQKTKEPVLIAEALPEVVEEKLEKEETSVICEESVAVEAFTEPLLLAENAMEEIQVDYETFKRIANYDPLEFLKEQVGTDVMETASFEAEKPKQELYFGRLVHPLLTVAAWIGNVRNERDELVNQFFRNI